MLVRACLYLLPRVVVAIEGSQCGSLVRGDSGGRALRDPVGEKLGAGAPRVAIVHQLIDQPDPSNRVLHDLEADPEQTVDVAGDHPDVVERLHEAVVDFLKGHEAQPQIVRLFEEGDPGDMAGYIARRPGYERWYTYWNHLLNSEVLS